VAVTSDERQSVVGLLQAGAELDEKGKRSLYGSLALTWRPVSWMELNPTILSLITQQEETAVISGGEVATVPVGGSVYSLFADRNLDETDLGLRGTVTFTRKLSLQFFFQVLIARGDHQNYRALIPDGGFDPAIGSVPSYDFNQGIFNANVLLRWEYLPGSSLYLVWTQERYGDSGMYETSFRDRFGEIFALPHDDVLFLKVSYWLPL
jgi:hypothetical protein